MKLVSVGFNYRSAPLKLRESLAFGRESSSAFCKRLVSSEVISECLVLCTCNRTEIYCVGSCLEGAVETIYNALSEAASCRREDLFELSYRHEGLDAVRHLFRVASSLDAMVVGESQILGQIKTAYQQATDDGTVGPYIHKIFHSAFRVAKRVRTETDIASRPVSVGTLAVDLIEDVAGPVARSNVLIIGAGEMSSLVTCRLKERGAEHIWIANRSLASAEALAAKVGGVVVPFGSWQAHLQTADVIVTSVSGGVMIREGDIKDPVEHVMIDLAVPRNVDESVKRLANVKLFNIDDLQGLAEKNLSARQEAAAKAEELVAAEAMSAIQELQYVRLAPVLSELQRKCELAVREGLERLYLENPNWSAKEKESVRSSVELIARKILHDPIKLAKEELVRPSSNENDAVNMIQDLFDV